MTLEEAERTLAEIERRVGIPRPSAAQRERSARIGRARRDGGLCGDCGRALEPGEPIWLARCYLGIGWSSTLCGTREVWWLVPVGQECIPNDDYGRYDPLAAGFPSAYDPWPRRCSGCGRPIYYRQQPSCGTQPSWCYCSDRCGWTSRNRSRSERRADARLRDCVVCGERFAPARSDAVTCSPACRQKAYRRRVQGAAS